MQQNLVMHIGKRIKDLMVLKGISTKEMADYCEVTPGAVSNWFSTGRISKQNLLKSAEKLKTPLSELITGDEAVPTLPIGDYSTEALALAWLLDQIPNRLAKTRANHDATASILAVLAELDVVPTRKPVAPENPKKQPA